MRILDWRILQGKKIKKNKGRGRLKEDKQSQALQVSFQEAIPETSHQDHRWLINVFIYIYIYIYILFFIKKKTEDMMMI